jgi:hypothetical protein
LERDESPPAIEPTIDQLKPEHRLERNRLKGTQGNAINALLSAAAMNVQKLLGFFFVPFTPLPAFVVRPGIPGSGFGGDDVRCLFQDRLVCLPRPKIRRHVAPWSPSAANPQDCLDSQALIPTCPATTMRPCQAIAMGLILLSASQLPSARTNLVGFLTAQYNYV